MKNNELKQLLFIILLSAVVVSGIGAFWYGTRYLPYRRMAVSMEKNNDEERPRYMYEDDEYLYSLKMPGFLSFQSGFLYVGPKNEDAAVLIVDDEGNLTEKNIPHVDVFIWPHVMKKTQYAVTLYEESYSVQIMTDSRGELIPDSDSTEAERENALLLYEKHKDEIHDVINAAVRLWGDEIQ